MPFFQDRDTAVLYIHVPKTGGTSVEQYLSRRFRAPLGERTLYSGRRRGGSLQHQPLSRLERDPRVAEAMRTAKNRVCFATVRCPYDRAVSDLLWSGRITPGASRGQVETALRRYLSETHEATDYHNATQVSFVDAADTRADIIKLEELGEGMRRLGFTDFDDRRKNMSLGRDTYREFLSAEARGIIEDAYGDDFEAFGYARVE